MRPDLTEGLSAMLFLALSTDAALKMTIPRRSGSPSIGPAAARVPPRLRESMNQASSSGCVTAGDAGPRLIRQNACEAITSCPCGFSFFHLK